MAFLIAFLVSWTSAVRKRLVKSEWQRTSAMVGRASAAARRVRCRGVSGLGGATGACKTHVKDTSRRLIASKRQRSQQAMRKAGAAAREARPFARPFSSYERSTDQPSVCSSRTRAPCPSPRGSHAAARSTPALCVSTGVAAANRASLLTPSLRLHLLRSSVPKLCYAGACGPSRRWRLVTHGASHASSV